MNSSMIKQYFKTKRSNDMISVTRNTCLQDVLNHCDLIQCLKSPSPSLKQFLILPKNVETIFLLLTDINSSFQTLKKINDIFCIFFDFTKIFNNYDNFISLLNSYQILQTSIDPNFEYKISIVSELLMKSYNYMPDEIYSNILKYGDKFWLLMLKFINYMAVQSLLSSLLCIECNRERKELDLYFNILQSNSSSEGNLMFHHNIPKLPILFLILNYCSCEKYSNKIKDQYLTKDNIEKIYNNLECDSEKMVLLKIGMCMNYPFNFLMKKALVYHPLKLNEMNTVCIHYIIKFYRCLNKHHHIIRLIFRILSNRYDNNDIFLSLLDLITKLKGNGLFRNEMKHLIKYFWNEMCDNESHNTKVRKSFLIKASSIIDDKKDDNINSLTWTEFRSDIIEQFEKRKNIYDKTIYFNEPKTEMFISKLKIEFLNVSTTGDDNINSQNNEILRPHVALVNMLAVMKLHTDIRTNQLFSQSYPLSTSH
ncbi:hypothetical protein TRFO_33661 [Tritrichomonas foetus]|uniref:Uncharacterized protein n=1 Tax=Tritrichomonas foetus TaxID=1144522 RepID=A0A1J4JMY9_9EUKA|nr:hypothetical protein TRFO_33661 [Tritrichomonas foetus]|eukprot:OHS99799.1 hypothetical protein TRFO_33661 [Tritrichomonas foetus]